MFIPPFSPQLLKSSCVPFSVLCTLELLCCPCCHSSPTHRGGSPSHLLVSNKREMGNCPSAVWSSSKLPSHRGGFGTPQGLAAFPGGTGRRGCIPSGQESWDTGQSNQLAPNLHYSPPSLMTSTLQNTTTERNKIIAGLHWEVSAGFKVYLRRLSRCWGILVAMTPTWALSWFVFGLFFFFFN